MLNDPIILTIFSIIPLLAIVAQILSIKDQIDYRKSKNYGEQSISAILNFYVAGVYFLIPSALISNKIIYNWIIFALFLCGIYLVGDSLVLNIKKYIKDRATIHN